MCCITIQTPTPPRGWSPPIILFIRGTGHARVVQSGARACAAAAILLKVILGHISLVEEKRSIELVGIEESTDTWDTSKLAEKCRFRSAFHAILVDIRFSNALSST